MKPMSRFAVIVALLTMLCAGANGAPAAASQCLTCHKELEGDKGPAHDAESDIHYQNGIGCSDCHGGDPKLDDMDAVRKSAGFRGVPERGSIPAFCARCHSDAAYMHKHNPSLAVDQLDKYKTSVHGIRLFRDKDQKVATCVSCHTAHRIGDARMPHSTTYPANVPSTCGACHSDTAYMASYGIPTDQEALFRKSVHGQAIFEKKDMGAPVCNTCHGNHGAAPPEAGSLSAVCGMCHAIEARLYQASPHGAAFAQQNLPMCETCHGNHGIEHPTDALVGLGSNQTCGNCHNVADEGPAPKIIDSIEAGLRSLTAAEDSARHLVQEASVRGMTTADQEFALKEANQLHIQIRSSQHAASLDSLRPRFAEGMAKTKAIETAAAGLIDEYHFRRWGLGVASLIITLLALLLYLKIRAIEKS
jgi:hypothetical protein